VYKRTLPPVPSRGWLGCIVNSNGLFQIQSKGRLTGFIKSQYPVALRLKPVAADSHMPAVQRHPAPGLRVAAELLAPGHTRARLAGPGQVRFCRFRFCATGELKYRGAVG
jgi:hypothetical protein